MTYRTAILTTALAISTAAFGCGEAGTTNTANTNSANTNTAKANANSPVAVNKAAPAQTTNNAPTLTPVFLAYCVAMENKDEPGIRKVYSKDTLEDFAVKMKDDGSKSLVDYLSTDRVSTKLCTIRNEVITGDTATAIVTTEGMPNGETIVFAKEGNEWKLTNKAPSLDSVKQAAPNSNTAK
jgi:Domain of unknown function (DUF4878)